MGSRLPFTLAEERLAVLTNPSLLVGKNSAVPRITRVDIPGAAGGAGSVVATMSSTSNLPTSSLYRTNPDAGKPKLIDTSKIILPGTNQFGVQKQPNNRGQTTINR